MEIRRKDKELFTSKNRELKQALLTLDAGKMLVFDDIELDEVKRVRSLATHLARRYQFELRTRYDSEEKKFYIVTSYPKIRDCNKAIEALEGYADMGDIVSLIREKRNEILRDKKIRDNTKE